MKPIPFVRASAVRPFASFLESIGAPVGTLWKGIGLAPRSLHESDAVLPLPLLVGFLDAAARSQGIPDLGHHVAARTEILSLGPVFESFRWQATLGQCIATLEARVSEHNSGARWWLASQGSQMRLCRRMRTNDAATLLHVDLFSLLTMIDLVRRAVGSGWHPQQVALQSTRAIPLSHVEALGSAQIAWGRPATAIAFPRAFLARPVAWPAAETTSGREVLATRGPPGGFVESVCSLIAALLEAGRLDVAFAAEAAGTSSRSFQRHLAEHRVSFTQLVEDVRGAAALRLLADTDRKVVDIAYQLGYSDPAHFTRAFRRWTSVSPREYRRLRSDEPLALPSPQNRDSVEHVKLA
jgi:AraC-like DNA-binding protein